MNKVGILIFFTGIVVISLIYRDYGITWDEGIQATYGEKVLDYYKTTGQDKSCNKIENLRFYGPLFDLFAASLTQFAPAYRFEIRHFLNALTGLATVLAVYQIGSSFGGSTQALIAALVLITTPRFFGHSFNNPKDIPFACVFAWSMYFLFRASSSKKIRPWFLVGVFIGLSLAIRVGGFPMLLVLLLSQLALATYQKSFTMSESATRVMLVSVVAWVVMLAIWPWSHESPILNPYLALKEALSFSFVIPVRFEGIDYLSDKLPRYYLLKYFLITTPLVTLLLASFGIISALISASKKEDLSINLTLVIWAAFPISAYTILKPNVYDEMRQFVFILPAVALLAGKGAILIIERAKTMNLAFLKVGIYLALVANIYPIYILHPYQTTYFNELVGGLRNAGKNYETDYWLNSYKEASEWLNSQLKGEKPIRIAVAGNLFAKPTAEYYLSNNISTLMVFSKLKQSKPPEGIEYYISTTRFGFDQNFPDMKILYTVQRDGVPFAVVKGESK